MTRDVGESECAGHVRLPAPSPAEVRAARKAAGLTQQQAGMLVSRGAAGSRADRAWQGYEADLESSDHREIPAAVWELFLLMTDQHPKVRLVARDMKGRARKVGVHP